MRQGKPDGSGRSAGYGDLSDALIKSLFEILLLVGVAASGYVVRYITSKGSILASNTKNQTALAEAKTDITMQTDRQIAAARDYFVQKTADVEKKNDKLEDKVEAYRTENIGLVGTVATQKGQNEVILLNLTNANAQIQTLSTSTGTLTAQLENAHTLITAQALEITHCKTMLEKAIAELSTAVNANGQYEQRITALEKQVADLTKALSEVVVERDTARAERDAAVNKLAAQTAPATATP